MSCVSCGMCTCVMCVVCVEGASCCVLGVWCGVCAVCAVYSECVWVRVETTELQLHHSTWSVQWEAQRKTKLSHRERATFSFGRLARCTLLPLTLLLSLL